ncbi:hypothetical protein BH24ACT12_BH24ACT12_09680 [soil metagenome]
MAEPIRRPEVDVLADYVEGLLDDDARAQVQRHIVEDPDTAALVAELETLPRLLAATPMEPMPADVVARVDAALARESQDRAAASAADRVGGLPRHRRWLVPAMAAAATAGIIAIAAPVVLDRGGPYDSLDGAADAPAAQEGRTAAASPESLSEQEDDEGGSQSPESLEQTDRPPALTSAEFASQVKTLYADAEPATKEDLAVTAADPQTLQQPLTLPAERLGERVAPVCDGAVESTFRTAILYDGESAYLLVYGSPVGGGPQQAVAFRCQGDEATILQQQPIDLP